MNSKPSSSKSNNSAISSDSKVLSKLRRLKIEEKLLNQSLQKLDRAKSHEVSEMLESVILTTKDNDYKNMMSKLKDSYINIRNLFDDVKTVSFSQELLAELEIDEIKKKVLELDTNLISFKAYLNKELNALKTAEQELIQQMNEMCLKQVNINKKRLKIPSASLSQIVPSPVRLLMTSPLKSSEVQEFQDFMKNSPNRYGGWIEYHHNIFVKYWHKYFGSCDKTDFCDTVVNNFIFDNFVDEVLLKLHGVDKSNLISHIEWYKKYLFLKDRQQRAIDKWKTNRRSMKNVPAMANNSENGARNNENCRTENTRIHGLNEIACEFIAISQEAKQKPRNQVLSKKIAKTIKKPTRKIIREDDIRRLMKPTKQWLSKNNNDNMQLRPNINHVENVEKLRIPNWRLFI